MQTRAQLAVDPDNEELQVLEQNYIELIELAEEDQASTTASHTVHTGPPTECVAARPSEQALSLSRSLALSLSRSLALSSLAPLIDCFDNS